MHSLISVAHTIQAWGVTCHAVGGVVRERFFGRIAEDMDVVVPVPALKLTKELARHLRWAFVPLDTERDIGRLAAPNGLTVDIARYTHPTLDADLRQRDLTINAMAVPLGEALLDLNTPFAELDVVDPCGGVADLHKRLIRGISKANFAADPLRLLRVFRFMARLEFTPTPETLAWVSELSPRIQQVAQERVIYELELLLDRPHAAPAMVAAYQCQLLSQLFPPLSPGFPQAVFEALERLENFIPLLAPDLSAYLDEALSGKRTRRALLKLALFLDACHDLTDCRAWGSTMRLGNRDAVMLERVRAGAALIHRWAGNLPAPNQLYHVFQELQEDVLGAVLLVQARASQLSESQQKICDWLQAAWFTPDHPVAHPPALLDGQFLMAELGLTPGPQIGKLLVAIKEAQAEQLVQTRAEALAYAARLFADNRQ
jgi:tRNA nucleotidyltransferase/poly(A) polymerase